MQSTIPNRDKENIILLPVHSPWNFRIINSCSSCMALLAIRLQGFCVRRHALCLALVALTATAGAGAESACASSKRGHEPMLCFSSSLLHRPLRSPERATATGGVKSVYMQKMRGRKAGEFDLVSGQDFDLLALR